MHKRRVQPIRRWQEDDGPPDAPEQGKKAKENCPNRAVLDPNVLQTITYRPLRRKVKPVQATHPEEHDHETASDLPAAQEDHPAA